ncbi:MAG: metallophosphoesterase, partial [Planctomycetota bacterium]
TFPRLAVGPTSPLCCVRRLIQSPLFWASWTLLLEYMQIAWITDPHLNHVPADRWDAWVRAIEATNVGEVLITGDISEGDDVLFELKRLSASFDGVIRFVLGNHDFYGGAIGAVRRAIVEEARQQERWQYLTDAGPVHWGEGCWLIGEDGWGDATIGDAESTPVLLQDFEAIEDFDGLQAEQRNQLLRELGRDSAERLRCKLADLPKDVSEIIVATHVPPFREACLYQGCVANDEWAPFFVNGQLGDVLIRYVSSMPRVKVRVLCGHSHHAGAVQMRENLVVHAGAASYGHPDIQGILHVTNEGMSMQLVGTR